jgi:hypothetical protein
MLELRQHTKCQCRAVFRFHVSIMPLYSTLPPLPHCREQQCTEGCVPRMFTSSDF